MVYLRIESEGAPKARVKVVKMHVAGVLRCLNRGEFEASPEKPKRKILPKAVTPSLVRIALS